MKKLSTAILILILIAGGVYAYNYLNIIQLVSTNVKADSRNEGIEISTHYEHYINPDKLIYNLKAVSLNNSAADVFRAFLQTADALKDKDFEQVELQYKGNPKFIVPGKYFKELGKDYKTENPVYTMRTFCEHITTPDGKQPYSEWSGGLLGVLTKQMDDFNDFHNKWYKNEL